MMQPQDEKKAYEILIEKMLETATVAQIKQIYYFILNLIR